jgi:hypothetical protein
LTNPLIGLGGAVLAEAAGAELPALAPTSAATANASSAAESAARREMRECITTSTSPY